MTVSLGLLLDLESTDINIRYSRLVAALCMTVSDKTRHTGSACMLFAQCVFLWGVDSVKSTVTVLEEGDFSEEGGGFNWSGYFSVGGYQFLWRRSAF